MQPSTVRSVVLAASFLAWSGVPALAVTRPDHAYPAPDISAYDDGAFGFVNGTEVSDQPVFIPTVGCSFGEPGDTIVVYAQMIGPDATISKPNALKWKQGANFLVTMLHTTNTIVWRVDNVVVPFCKGSLGLVDKDKNFSFYDAADVATFGLSCAGDLATAMGLTPEQKATFDARTAGEEASCKGKVVGDINNGCFRGDTIVATETGAKAIRDVKVGERVWSWDEVSQKKVLSAVTRTYVHAAAGLRTVRAGEEVLRTTDVHPFFVEGKGWVRADALAVGDRLKTEGSDSLIVSANTPADATAFYAGYDGPSPVAVKRAGIHRAALDVSPLLADDVVYNIEVDGTHSYFVGKSEVLVHNK